MKLPNHKLIIGPKQPAKGFLKTVSHKVDFVFENGERDSMVVDSIERKSMDVVVIVPYYYKSDYDMRVYLRSCIRPSLASREYNNTGRWDKHKENPIIWELPAGLIELEEIGINGVFSAALRELEEETGFSTDERWRTDIIGKPYFASIGCFAERLYTVMVDISGLNIKKPTEDGSALEKYAVVEEVSLNDALDMIERGKIVDSKTILALYRLKMEMEKE